MADSPQQGRRLRAVLRALCLGAVVILGATGVALVGAEVLVRLVAPQQLVQTRPDLWEPIDTLGYLRRPDISVSINTGERTVTVRTDRDRNRIGASGRINATRRVLLLGDSFVEALQVEHEESVAALLERAVAQAIGETVAVRNAGVSGWGPGQYLARARQMLPGEEYALLIVALFVGNDAQPQRRDYLPPRQPAARSRLRMPTSLAPREWVAAVAKPINDALEPRSHLFILSKNALATLRLRLGLSAEYVAFEYRRSEASAARWEVTAEVAGEIAAMAQAAGVPTLFVLVPERFQVYTTEFYDQLSTLGLDPSQYDLEQPSRRLLEEFTNAGLHVVDALPAMRAAPAVPELFGKVDKHLSPAGHEVLAAAILPDVLARLRD